MIGAAAAIGLGGVWLVGSVLTLATNSEVAVPSSAVRVVHIASTAGVELAATYRPASVAGSPAILLLHGNGANRDSMRETADILHGQGYAVLSIDFRGHGQSTPAGKSFGLFEADDAHAALAWLRKANPGVRTGAIGFSLGGAASLLGSNGPLDVDALVLEGVYPDIRHAIFNRLAIRLGRWPAAIIEPFLTYQSLPRFGVWPSAISPQRALEHVRMPVMVVGGAEDHNTPPDETRMMYNAVKTHGEFHILAGMNHDDLGCKVPEDFKVALLAFLRRNLKT